MVVVDSSALIPLAWIGRLDLVNATFEEIETTAGVEAEVLVEGKRGTGALSEFFDDVVVHARPERASDLATMEGISETDAAVVLLARHEESRLLANDKGLIEVARSHDVECWWVTTLLLSCTKEGVLDAEAGTDVLYELVDAGMNLSPQVYARVQDKLEKLGDRE